MLPPIKEKIYLLDYSYSKNRGYYIYGIFNIGSNVRLSRWILSRPVYNNVLILHNAKKKISVIVLTSKNTAMNTNI